LAFLPLNYRDAGSINLGRHRPLTIFQYRTLHIRNSTSARNGSYNQHHSIHRSLSLLSCIDMIPLCSPLLEHSLNPIQRLFHIVSANLRQMRISMKLCRIRIERDMEVGREREIIYNYNYTQLHFFSIQFHVHT
jgi:hypothetical protein